MRHVLPKMPAENSEPPQFFEKVEKLFLMYEVPDEVQAKLLIPLLTAQAKALVNRMCRLTRGICGVEEIFVMTI